MEKRFFKNSENGDIIVVERELEKFAYLSNYEKYSRNGEEYNCEQMMACVAGEGTPAIFALGTGNINTFTPDWLKDADGDPIQVKDLDDHAEGMIYWDGHNFTLVILRDDFEETGWEELHDMPEIDFSECVHNQQDVSPGVNYSMFKDDDDEYWLREYSRWQGSVPWDSLYKVATEDYEKWVSDSDFFFKDLINVATW